VDGQIRIKKYIIIQPVGSGSYSKCYLVKNTDSDSTYVAKVIPKRKLEILQK
jgi:serine/threonine protein kinase